MSDDELKGKIRKEVIGGGPGPVKTVDGHCELTMREAEEVRRQLREGQDVPKWLVGLLLRGDDE
jgi:hypothetical protein